MHVRHDKKDLLEKLSDLPMLISQKLSTPISLDVYAHLSQALVNGKKMGSILLYPDGCIMPIYIAPLNNERYDNST